MRGKVFDQKEGNGKYPHGFALQNRSVINIRNFSSLNTNGVRTIGSQRSENNNKRARNLPRWLDRLVRFAALVVDSLSGHPRP